jgi:autoinducer 2-degrading protein
MVVTTVIVRVKSGHIPAFIEATVMNHEKSVREPGNMRFDVLQSTEDPSAFLLYEAYDTPESASAHKTTAHYAEWRDTVAGWMAEPRKGVPYRAIVP